MRLQRLLVTLGVDFLCACILNELKVFRPKTASKAERQRGNWIIDGICHSAASAMAARLCLLTMSILWVQEIDA